MAGIGNAVESLSRLDAYDPNVVGHPDLDMLIVLLQRLSRNPIQRPEDATGQDQSGLRAHAAASWMSLAPKYSSSDPSIVDAIERMATDPHAEVRWEIARRLRKLVSVEEDLLWTLAGRIAAEEMNEDVLTVFIGVSILPLCQIEPTRCETLVERMLIRMPLSESDSTHSKKDLARAIGNVAAQLYIVMKLPKAKTWLLGWAADTASNHGLICPS